MHFIDNSCSHTLPCAIPSNNLAGSVLVRRQSLSLVVGGDVDPRGWSSLFFSSILLSRFGPGYHTLMEILMMNRNKNIIN